MLVLGSGPGGYSAAFRAADLGIKTVLVERYAALGGVCLNVGCIPSKALLHTAAVMDEVKTMGEHGITYAAPTIELDKLRRFKDGVVRKLTGGLAGMAKARRVDVVRGIGRFVDPHHLEVQLTSGDGREATAAKKMIRFDKAIIAAGSEAMKLPFMPDDPRIVDSTGALAAAVDSETDARRRRRHHRARDGERVLVAWQPHRCRRDAGWRHDGRRPRSREGVGKEERAALRQAHAEDENRVRRSDHGQA